MAKHGKKSWYVKSLLIYSCILLALSITAWIYVYNTMVSYENGIVDVYMNKLIKEMKTEVEAGNSKKYFEIKNVSNAYEKNVSLEDGYKQLFKGHLTYKKVKGEENTYNLLSDGFIFAKVKLDGSKKINRLLILNYPEWKVDEVISYADGGFYTYDFYVKDTYKVTLNGVEIQKEDLVKSEELPGLKEGYTYVNLPRLNHYTVKGLTFKPNVEIKDENGKEVKPQFEDSTYTASDFYETDNFEEAKNLLQGNPNPVFIAKEWSNFLTAEYDMEAGRGFNHVSPYLIEGTQMYQKGLAWATNVDITFTSVHTLDSIDNEKISNIVVYSDSAFSCDVYFEKNMTLIDKQKRQEVFNEKMYFIYYNGEYRVISMKSITE